MRRAGTAALSRPPPSPSRADRAARAAILAASATERGGCRGVAGCSACLCLWLQALRCVLRQASLRGQHRRCGLLVARHQRPCALCGAAPLQRRPVHLLLPSRAVVASWWGLSKRRTPRRGSNRSCQFQPSRSQTVPYVISKSCSISNHGSSRQLNGGI